LIAKGPTKEPLHVMVRALWSVKFEELWSLRPWTNTLIYPFHIDYYPNQSCQHSLFPGNWRTQKKHNACWPTLSGGEGGGSTKRSLGACSPRKILRSSSPLFWNVCSVCNRKYEWIDFVPIDTVYTQYQCNNKLL
jgi:hypothetical protein